MYNFDLKCISEECREDIKNRIRRILESTPSYTNREGYTQLQFVPTAETGRNLQQEQAEADAKAKAEREAAKAKPKNQNRVEGGKRSHETRRKNKIEALNNSPILKALNYKLPTEDSKGDK